MLLSVKTKHESSDRLHCRLLIWLLYRGTQKSQYFGYQYICVGFEESRQRDITMTSVAMILHLHYKRRLDDSRGTLTYTHNQILSFRKTQRVSKMSRLDFGQVLHQVLQRIFKIHLVGDVCLVR